MTEQRVKELLIACMEYICDHAGEGVDTYAEFTNKIGFTEQELMKIYWLGDTD